MRIACVPISVCRGLSSPISRDFSSAPFFLLVDVSTLAHRAVPNTPQRRSARGCDACEALEDATVDVVIADQIDEAVLAKLAARDIPVHAPARGMASDALAALIGGTLPAARMPPRPARDA